MYTQHQTEAALLYLFHSLLSICLQCTGITKCSSAHTWSILLLSIQQCYIITNLTSSFRNPVHSQPFCYQIFGSLDIGLAASLFITNSLSQLLFTAQYDLLLCASFYCLTWTCPTADWSMFECLITQFLIKQNLII